MLLLGVAFGNDVARAPRTVVTLCRSPGWRPAAKIGRSRDLALVLESSHTRNRRRSLRTSRLALQCVHHDTSSAAMQTPWIRVNLANPPPRIILPGLGE